MTEKVRLVGGDNTSGRIEIYYNRTWGTICHTGWTMKNSDVLCQQLGYERALLFHQANYLNFSRETEQVNLIPPALVDTIFYATIRYRHAKLIHTIDLVNFYLFTVG